MGSDLPPRRKPAFLKSDRKRNPNPLLLVAILSGFLAFFYYLSFWFEGNHYRQPWLWLLLFAALLYGGMQMAGNWIIYLFARQTPPPPPSSAPSVDIFVTAYDESFELVKKALAGAVAVKGDHRTWLLDDSKNPAFEQVAAELGAGYLTRTDHTDAKAGNVNMALPRTHGQIIAIFDIDHVPEPDFLERTLGYFQDPQMGFVQVMLTFKNGAESWVAKAAIETSLEFYNPTSMGANGIGGATLMGSNALIRRQALESIGGYQPGLAEDLATSIALHAAGWKSAYVLEPLAPGLAPPSFVAWFTQQLKWARGVFELLLTSYPRLFKHLTWGQRLSYAVRMTKYWIGPVVGFHLFATIAVLIFGGAALRAAFHDYLIHITPLAMADTLIRTIAFRTYRHESIPRTSLLRAVALVYATWPIYLLAWGMALLRWPLGFRPTPKRGTDVLHPAWLLPQMVALLLLIFGTLYTILIKDHPLSILLLFAILQAALQFGFLLRWLYSDTPFKNSRARLASEAPVAVMEVDFNHLPERLAGLDRFHQAFFLVRMGCQPAGQALVDVAEGLITRENLRQKIIETADWPFWQRQVQGYVGWEEVPGLASVTPTATIAVCTRDRPDDLRSCLEGIALLPDLGQEVLVVDSCSATEATQQVVAAFPKVRYVREEYPGLNRARNRAFLEAGSEVIAFIDDDAIPDQGWLEALLRNFADPHVSCVTGLTLPVELETRAQQWFERYSAFGRGFQRKVYDKDVIHPLVAGHVGAGVNMALRRRIAEVVGPFDEALDAGTPTRSGGDTEMFARILSAGRQIVYDPAALSWHRHRRDWKSLRRTIYGYGSGTYAFWTRKLLLEGEFSVFFFALQWAFSTQLPAFLRSVLHFPGWAPLDILAAEFLGCLAGPFNYLTSRKQLEERTKHGYQPYRKIYPGEHYYPHLQPQRFPSATVGGLDAPKLRTK